MKKRALISVFDKNGILEFARSLERMDWEIISTGGTYKYLNDNLIVMNSETTSKIYNAKGTYLSTELTEDDLLENCIGKYKGNFYFKGKTGDKNYIYILRKK